MPPGFVNLVVLLTLAVFSSGCSDSKNETSSLPFEYTNVVYEAGHFAKRTEGTIIYFTNGTWFSHEPGKLTLGIGTSDYEATVFFNPTNREITKIIQQTTAGTNQYWLVDFNGDGLADQREAFGSDNKQVLFRGEWIDSRRKSKNREVLLDGRWIELQFTNGTWIPIDFE